MSENLADIVSRILLPRVKAPAQYIGGEINQIRKPHRPDDITIALAFPDTYAIGSSNLSLAILYDLLNRLPDTVAERTFCPWIDAAEVMRNEDIPLFSWESRTPIGNFDILGITLQHELSYSNVLYLLDLAGITFRAVDRREDEPMVFGLRFGDVHSMASLIFLLIYDFANFKTPTIIITQTDRDE